VYITLAVAMSLVVFVIYLFLGTKRAAIVPAITVPICLIGTATALYGFGLSINLLTLLALVLSIGLVVDDSIVVLENVQRRIDLGERPLVAAFRGAREVAFAVIATTLVVIAVFVPIAFLEGLTGRLFRELAVTVSAAVAISSFVALSLSAMLCSKLLTSREPERGLARKAHALVGALQRRYEGALRIWLGHPRIIGAGLVVILVGIGLLFSRVPLELEPPEDRGAFMVMMRAPEGASFDYSVAHMRELEEKVLFPLLERGVATNVLSRVPFGYRSTAMNSGMNVIVLAPWNEREESAHSLMSEVAQKAGQVPGIFAIPIGYSGMGRSGSDRPVQLVIGGSDHDEVGAWQERVIAAARDIPGLRGPRGDYQPTKPQMRVEIDRSRAGDLGVSVAAIGRTLETMLGSARVTTYIDRGEEYDVVLQAEPAQRASPTDLSNLYVRSERTDELIPLSNLVALREVAEPGTLRRFNRLPAATVAASVAEGHALGDVLAALENLARSELPAAAHFDYKGESLDFVESSNAAYFTFTLALLIVFLVLAAQFESFVHPLVIMLTVPLAVAGGLLGLVLTDGTLNIYSQIGMTILIGLAAKNGILIVEFANQLRAQGRGFDQAVVEAARTRLRPILMTGISTAIGALPLVLASGAGSGGRQTIGVVVFGGVLFATLFTLVVVPVAYSVLARGTKLPGTVERQLERYEGAEPGGVASAH
jgi:multidrug efflux pump